MQLWMVKKSAKVKALFSLYISAVSIEVQTKLNTPTLHTPGLQTQAIQANNSTAKSKQFDESSAELRTRFDTKKKGEIIFSH